MVTTDYTKGSVCWIDLGSPDTAAAAAFYEATFGWSLQSAGPDAGGYGFFQQDGDTVAAIGPLTEEGAKSGWTVYFSTPDAAATAKGVEQGGGVVRVPPMDVMAAGSMGQFTDPAGGQFAVWQPGETKGLDAVGEDNTFVWAELHTDDQKATVGFYQSLFDWRAGDPGIPGVEYTVLMTESGGDDPAAAFGGVAGVHPGMDAGWLVYFAVADTDATVAAATAAGGTVVMPADDVPTVGRIAIVADPFGATFALLKPEPRQ
ncbi:VOC family protein [Kitasatospora sp. NPDC048365]|uniref:VOC family protein n=1 Tax=Kitasatospora sp. NPDC048365 TaxID=3364050 RepID=UPI003723100E